MEQSYTSPQFSSVTQSCPTLWPHGPQHTRAPCPSPSPGDAQTHVHESVISPYHLILCRPLLFNIYFYVGKYISSVCAEFRVYLYLSIYIYTFVYAYKYFYLSLNVNFRSIHLWHFFPLVYFLACSSTTLCCVSAGVSVMTTKEIVVYLTKHSGTGEMCHSKQNMSRR